ncbi:MAG: hypothetical protein PHR35_21870 [Kiritimatiellae bacterium]|nr:hypothetical protein [Kiritimatiellia bacterium]
MKSKRGTYTWHFPLPRTHTGILLGNGRQGLMVWGETTLNITIGRAGFWDHRGGNPILGETTFREVRARLEADDEKAIRALFGSRERKPGLPPSPRQYGGGRVELAFADGFRPVTGLVRLDDATLTVALEAPDGRTANVVVRQDVRDELAWVELDEAAHGPVTVKLVAAWDVLKEQLASVGVSPPRRWQSADGGGFVQTLPEDAPLAIAWERRSNALLLATALGPDAEAQARQLSTTAATDRAVTRTRRWWKAYWRDIPRVELPDADQQFAYNYGCYKQAGLSTPGAPAATLQGPWMEEYQIPPWSNDYHFNINVQLVYGSCYATNRLAHLEPLWAMIREWLPTLRKYAEHFFQAPGALMLPHAVDDRCQVIGAFWSGTIDHACTAWMAQMAWLHYRYSMDEQVLRELAWPLLNGAFNGFWAMLEEVEEGGVRRLTLPVSVSPEFSSGTMRGTWGRDSSFQLAAVHMLADILPRAARVLKEPEDPRWSDAQRRLPPYSTAPAMPWYRSLKGRRIALWHDVDLPRSHRHHSHLASIWPFRTVDPFDPAHTEVVAHSLQHWSWLGAGEWTGWCIPWAAILCARCNQADAALLWLKWWQYLYTNTGHGTLHNADFGGCTGIHDGALFEPRFAKPQPFAEVMQMDAGMAAVSAILELLVQCRADAIHVAPALPKWWRELRFDGVRTEGAFLVGATVEAARVKEVRVTSLAGAPLKLAHGLGDTWTLNGQPRHGPMLECPTRAGETLTLAGSCS